MGLLQNVLGSIKDMASNTKATLMSDTSQTLTLRLAVVRATTYDPTSLPSTRHLLSLSSSLPRTTAHAAVDALISCLNRTSSSAVALKCLLVLHSVVHRGSFILHDQISLFLSGRRNYLIRSDFRDASSSSTWDLSTCIRWYARYLEQILTASRVLGHFLFSLSCRHEKERATENIPSQLNADLLREIDALIGVIEEISRFPDNLNPVGESELVNNVSRMVAEDYSLAVSYITSRIDEFTQRLNYLCFTDWMELVCALRRLVSYKERVVQLLPLTAKSQLVTMWKLAGWLREDMEAVSENVEETAGVSLKRVPRTGGWIRFHEPTRANMVRFSSNRY